MGIVLRLTGRQHAAIKSHVIAADGNEAGSLLFCESVRRDDGTLLLVKNIMPIPYESCTQRTPVFLSWPTEEFLMPAYETLEKQGLSLIMLHSHPTGLSEFSCLDDENDLKILPRLTHCIVGDQLHGSAIMLPNGFIKARVMTREGYFLPIEKIAVAGDEILFFKDDVIGRVDDVPTYMDKSAQVYGSATVDTLRNLKIGIVGCSGTGSPLIELLLRYHVGELILIDFDKIEEGNLNRMLMSRVRDVESQKLKVDRYAEWIQETGLPTHVNAINGLVPSEETTRALSECDIIFGCVDNAAARHAINKISCAYLIPYFDLGVAIKGDKQDNTVRQAIARCYYLQPDQACLLDREAFSSERLADENWRRDDPAFYRELKEAGYTQNSNDIQAVMVLTMKAAIMGVDDLMARLHAFRVESNKEFDEQEHSFTHGYYKHQAHSADNMALRLFVGVGDKHTRM